MDKRIYNEKSDFYCVKTGKYREALFAVCSFKGAYPEAYVEVREEVYKKKKELFDPLFVHGGFTNAEYLYLGDIGTTFWVGWNYAHEGDYIHSNYRTFENDKRKKYSVEEVEKQCKDCIDKFYSVGIFNEKKRH